MRSRSVGCGQSSQPVTCTWFFGRRREVGQFTSGHQSSCRSTQSRPSLPSAPNSPTSHHHVSQPARQNCRSSRTPGCYCLGQKAETTIHPSPQTTRPVSSGCHRDFLRRRREPPTTAEENPHQTRPLVIHPRVGLQSTSISKRPRDREAEEGTPPTIRAWPFCPKFALCRERKSWNGLLQYRRRR